MSHFRSQLLTALLALVLGACIVASWLHFRPLEIPRFARVEYRCHCCPTTASPWCERVKPGMDATEQGKLFEEAKAFGLRLDTALEQVA
jgi:hypothetical protein